MACFGYILELEFEKLRVDQFNVIMFNYVLGIHLRIPAQAERNSIEILK